MSLVVDAITSSRWPASTTPTAWEVVAALVILALTLVIAIWIASRISSASVLLYGQRAGFRTIFRATRVSR